MSDDTNRIVLEVDVDPSKAIQSFDSINKSAQQVKQTTAEITDSFSSAIPGFNQYLNRQNLSLSEQVAGIHGAQQAILQQQNERAKSYNTKVYANNVETYKLTAQNTQDMVRQAQSLATKVTDGVMEEFTKSISNIMPDIGKYMTSQAKKAISSGRIMDAKALAFGAMNFQTMVSEAGVTAALGKTDNKDVTRFQQAIQKARQTTKGTMGLNDVAQYFELYAKSNLPQYMMSDFLGGRKGSVVRAANFRDMLPKAFEKIAVDRTKANTAAIAAFNQNEVINEQEFSALMNIVKSNTYAADAAVKHGLMRKSNGRFYLNTNATRTQVNAMAGDIFQDFVVGARGAGQYGIQNVEDPDMFYKIIRKQNKRILGSREAAYSMQDAFGWLSPMYMENVDNPRSRSVRGSEWKYGGHITQQPKQTSYEYAMYDIDKLPSTPEAFLANRTQSIKREDGSLKSASEFNRVLFNNSLYRQMVHRIAGENLQHNDYSDTFMYMKLPEIMARKLVDPKASSADRLAIEENIAKIIGGQYGDPSDPYVYTRTNGEQFEFIKKSVRDKMLKIDPDFFAGGNVEGRKYKTWEEVAKAIEYRNKGATEGEDIRDLYGSDLSKLNIVLTDMKKLGFDGANFLSNRLTGGVGFQGRMEGIKAAFSSLDFNGLLDIYSRLNEEGSAIVTGEGRNRRLVLKGMGLGEDATISNNTDLVVDIQNVKNAAKYFSRGDDGNIIWNKKTDGTQYSAKDIVSDIQRDADKYGIYAKTTFDQQNTETRWLSQQVARTMVLSDDAQKYFRNNFINELMRLNDNDYVKKILFSGTDELSQEVSQDISALASPAAQNRIAEYRQRLILNNAQGKLLMPSGVANYAMAAPWALDVFNAALKAGGGLTEQQARAMNAMSVKDDAYYANSIADALGIERNPATYEGNIPARNLSKHKGFVALANKLGIDPNAVYLRPGSVILDRMQGEDFDGDMNQILSLLNGPDPEFARIMTEVYKATEERYQANLKQDPDAQRRRIAGQTNPVDVSKQLNMDEYSATDPRVVAHWFATKLQQNMMMGGANAVNTRAWQYGISDLTAHALADAQDHYDIVSTYAKKPVDYKPTQQEIDILSGGDPFLEIFNRLAKAHETVLDKDGSLVRMFKPKDPSEFRRRFDRTNLTSFRMGSDLNNLLSNYISANMTGNEGLDSLGLKGAEIEDFLNTFEDWQGPAVRKYLQKTRGIKMDIAKGKYLAPSDITLAETDVLGNAAYEEIMAQVAKEMPTASDKERREESVRRFNSIGGNFTNFVKQHGITRKSLRENPWLMEAVEQIASLHGKTVDQMFDKTEAMITDEEEMQNIQKQLDEAQRQAEEKTQQIDSLNKQKEKLQQQQQKAKRPSKARTSQLARIEESIKQAEESKKAILNQIQALQVDQGDLLSRITFNKELDDFESRIGELSGSTYGQNIKNQVKSGVLTPGQAFSDKQRARVKSLEAAYDRLQKNGQFADLPAHRKDAIKTNFDTMRQRIEDSIFNEAYAQNMDVAESISSIARRMRPGYDSRQEVIDQARRRVNDAKSYIDAIKYNPDTATEEQKKTYEQTVRQQLAAEESLKEIERGVQFQREADLRKASASYFSAQMRSNVPRRSFTKLGRMVNARFQQNAQRYEAYNNTTNMVDLLNRQYEEAIQSGNYDKAQELGLQLRAAQIQQRQYRGFGISGAIRERLTARYNDYSARAAASEVSYKEALAKSQDQTLSKDERDQWVKKANDAKASFSALNAGAGQAQGLMQSFNAVASSFGGTIDRVITGVSRLASQFGRRIFYNAIREATQFVKQYDTTMKQIQAITLKSDAEMQGIRTSSIQQAIRLRTSTTNVAQVKADLYRQGLSDAEVESRSDAILKFATVTGTKVTAATKIITTALQNDLVSSAQQAMDVLTALGDSAATTAEEIGKGMQKSAAAAKVAGVSYEELASMLTIITSKTQLGGTQAGTALQAIFNRMHRVTTSNLVTDEAGESVDINDVEKSLRVAGVSLRKENGDYRDTVEVLRDLAKVWNELNDIQKNAVMYSMAGGRQSNMFASLMEGFAEDDGKELDKLLGLASDSEGITQTKYEIAVSGINGQLEELKATWDGLVQTIVENGQLQGILGTITNIAKVFGNIIENMGAGNALLTTMITLTGIMIAKESILLALKTAGAAASAAANGEGYTAAIRAASVGAAIVGVLGLVAGVGGTLALNANKGTQEVNKQQQWERAKEGGAAAYTQGIVSNYAKRTQNTSKAINVIESYRDKYGEQKSVRATDAENMELEASFSALNYYADVVAGNFQSLSEVVDAASNSLKQMKKTADDISLENLLENILKSDNPNKASINAYKDFLSNDISQYTAAVNTGQTGKFAPASTIYLNNDSIQNLETGEIDGKVAFKKGDNVFVLTDQGLSFDYGDQRRFTTKDDVLFNSRAVQNLIRYSTLEFDATTKMLAALNSDTQRFFATKDLAKGNELPLGSLFPSTNLFAVAYEAHDFYTQEQKQLIEDWLSYSKTVTALDEYVKDDENLKALFGNGSTSYSGVSLLTHLKDVIEDDEYTEEAKRSATQLLEWFMKNYEKDIYNPDQDFHKYMDSLNESDIAIDAILNNSSFINMISDRLNNTQINVSLRKRLREAFSNGEDLSDNKVLAQIIREIVENPYEDLRDSDFEYQLRIGNDQYGFFENTEESLRDSLRNRYKLEDDEIDRIVSSYYLNDNWIDNLYRQDEEQNDGYSLAHQTTSEIIKQMEAERTAKDRGYRSEKSELMNLANQAKSVDEFFDLVNGDVFSNLMPLIKNLGLEDLFIGMENKTGEYDYESFRDALYNKIFGTSRENAIKERYDAALNIDQMNAIADRVDQSTWTGAAIKAEDIQAIADTIHMSTTWVKQNKVDAVSMYRNKIGQQQDSEYQNIRSGLMDRLGTLSTNKYLTNKEMQEIQANNGKAYVAFDTKEEAQRYNYENRDIYELSTGRYGLALKQWQLDDSLFKDENGYYRKQTYGEFYKNLDDDQKKYIQDLEDMGYKISANDKGYITISRNGKTFGFDEYVNARNFDVIRTDSEKASLISKVVKAAQNKNDETINANEFLSIWDQILDGGDISSTEAEYLKQNAPEVFEYYNMTEEQRNSERGRALEQQIDIQVQTAGISDLEQLGDMLEGTEEMISRLKQNNRIKIQAEYELINQGYEEGQLSAAVLYGSPQEKAQAAERLLGVSSDLYWSEEESFNRQMENMIRSEAYQRPMKESLEREYAETKNSAVIAKALRAGYEVVKDKDGNVLYDSNGNVQFKFNEDLLRLNHVNPYKSQARQYTPEELASAAERYYKGEDIDYNELVALSNAGLGNFNRLQWYRFSSEGQDVWNKLSDEEKARSERLARQDIVAYRLSELESRGELGYGLASMYSGLSSEDYSTRMASIAQFSQVLQNLNTAGRYGALLEQNVGNQGWWYSEGASMIDELGQMFNWTQPMIESFKNPDNIKDLKRAIDDQVKDINNTLITGINNLGLDGFDMSGLEDIQAVIKELNASGDPAAQSIAAVLNVLKEALGLEWSGKEFTSGSTEVTGNDLIDAAANATYSKRLNQNRIDAMYDLMTTGGVTDVNTLAERMVSQGLFTDKQDALDFFTQNEQIGYSFAGIERTNTPYRNADEYNDYLMDNGYMRIGEDVWKDGYKVGSFTEMYREAQKNLTGGIITEENIAAVRNASSIGSMYLDPKYEHIARLNEILSGDYTNDEKNQLIQEELGSTNGQEFQQAISQLEGYEAFQSANSGVGDLSEAMETLRKSSESTLVSLGKYGKQSKDVASKMNELAGSTKQFASAQRSANSAMTSAYNNQYFRQLYRNGDRSDEVIKAIESQTGLSENIVKNGGQGVLSAIDAQEAADTQEIQDWANAYMEEFKTEATQYLDGNELVLDSGMRVEVGGVEITQNDEAQKQLAGMLNEKQQEFVNLLQAFGIKYHFDVGEEGHIKIIIDGLGSGGKGGGGGGGGGKSSAQKLIERLKREKEISDHRLKMLQYTQTFYEQRGEYTNMAELLPTEKNLRLELIEEYEKAIEDLVAEMSKTKKESDDWYSLRESILAYEEAIEECKNAIDKINRTQEEYYQNARKTRTALEQTVDQEIRNRIQRERDMLDGTVSMENTILDAIKARYQEEWDLVTRDIEKKRQALEEEKSLIDERLNARKEAEDEAEKYEELAELRRQYSLVSMDSTRTKDAAELRQKISDIEKEIMWKQMEDEAKAQQDALDDQINAYDQFTENGDEDLQALLENANNFADEVNSVLYEKQDDLFNWLKENVADYANSLDEMQKQMINSWTDTYKQMWGITDVFWAQINGVLMTEDEFIAYMKESQDYINASDTDKEIMEQDWKWAYQDYVSAYLTGAAWDHSDEFNQYGTAANSGNGNGSGKKTDVPQLSVAGAVAGAMNYLNQLMTSETKKWMDMMSGPEKITVEYSKYDSGGLVDYTGPAWVDGTPSRPEAFLSAEDTALIRGWLDSAKYVRTRAYMSNIDSSNFSGATNTIGDVNITITEASFKDDADYEEVAERVGQVFVREIAKQGFMTPAFAF